MITFKMNSDTVYIIESRLLHKFGGVIFYKKRRGKINPCDDSVFRNFNGP